MTKPNETTAAKIAKNNNDDALISALHAAHQETPDFSVLNTVPKQMGIMNQT